jgi:hypothetical protein
MYSLASGMVIALMCPFGVLDALLPLQAIITILLSAIGAYSQAIPLPSRSRS